MASLNSLSGCVTAKSIEMEVTPKWCEDHRTPFFNLCPFCLDGVEPVRFVEARADFRHTPLSGTVDILPQFTTVKYADVVSTLGQQLADIERAMAIAMAPFQDQKAVIHKQMRAVRLDPRAFTRAIRIHLGMQKDDAYSTDKAVQDCLQAIRAGGLR